MNATTPNQPPRRPWIKWALIASLGLNLGLAGMIGGGLVGGPRDASPPVGLMQFGRALPDPYRHDLGRALRESRSDWIGLREGLRDQRAALAAALTAEPFDPAAVALVLEHGADLADALGRHGTALLVAQVARMDPEKRAAYAEALLRDKPGHDRPDREKPDRDGSDHDRPDRPKPEHD